MRSPPDGSTPDDLADRHAGHERACRPGAEGDQAVALLDLGLAVEELDAQRAVALPGGEAEFVGLSMRVPTVKSGSLASRTVAVSGPTVVTRPTRPSPLRTVMSRVMPSSAAGVDGDGPGEALGRSYGDDLGALDAVLAGAGGLEHLVELGRPGAVAVVAAEFRLERRVLAAPARRAGRGARRSRGRRDTALPTGSTADDTPFSTGPKTVAAACRAPSSGDCSPPRMSTVISANAMATSSTSSSRLSRVSLTCGGRAFLVGTCRGPGVRVLSVSGVRCRGAVSRRSADLCLDINDPPHEVGHLVRRNRQSRVICAAGRRGPAGAPRTPRRTCRSRAPRSPAGPRRCGWACRSRAAAARRGRAAARRRRSARCRGP